MKKKSYRPYLFLGLFLLSLFYLPNALVQGMRSSSTLFSKRVWGATSDQRMEEENFLLKRQNETLRSRLLSEERINHQMEKLKTLVSIDEAKGKAFYKRRREKAEKLLKLELFSVHAEVIHRSPTYWNSVLWVNVGERDNQELGERVIAPGSPVLKGEHLIGVVERVEASKSSVRLLTDSSLVVSVQVARGSVGNRELLRRVDTLMRQLVLRNEPQEILVALGKLKERLSLDSKDCFLAKGEIYGSSSPLWRGRSEILKGVGFNYDFEDVEGPALELRTGRPLDELNKEETLPLIDVGDLLITTGMDGVFPKDIPVAYVNKVGMLQEGSTSFDIEAELCAGNLDALVDVTILPSIEDAL